MSFDPFKDGGATELADDFDPFKDGGATELGKPQGYLADKARRLGRAIPENIGQTVAGLGSAVQSGAELAAEALRWRAVRSGDLTEADAQTPDQVVALLVAHKQLLQRPVLVTADKAIIGRPKDRVRELLS